MSHGIHTPVERVKQVAGDQTSDDSGREAGRQELLPADYALLPAGQATTHPIRSNMTRSRTPTARVGFVSPGCINMTRFAFGPMRVMLRFGGHMT